MIPVSPDAVTTRLPSCLPRTRRHVSRHELAIGNPPLIAGGHISAAYHDRALNGIETLEQRALLLVVNQHWIVPAQRSQGSSGITRLRAEKLSMQTTNTLTRKEKGLTALRASFRLGHDKARLR
jgi:hypothetical protein